MTALEMIKLLVPGADEALEQLQLDLAEQALLVETNRDALPDALVTCQVELAVMAYNRMGAEGESSHSEGGVSRSYEALPEGVRRQLNRYRLARVGGESGAAAGAG